MVNELCFIFMTFPPRSLKLDLPKPEESPPAPWWNVECDHSLLVGIVKHGMCGGWCVCMGGGGGVSPCPLVEPGV